jgi:hypothetical protein
MRKKNWQKTPQHCCPLFVRASMTSSLVMNHELFAVLQLIKRSVKKEEPDVGNNAQGRNFP